MKTLVLSVFILLLCIKTTAQVPESFNYQAIVRDGGDILSDQTVSYRFSIIKGALPGAVVYTESYSITTNEFGLVNLSIGKGTDKTGDFTLIEWGADSYSLKVEIDPAGGNTYTDMGTTQLLSVPYALYAKNSAGSVPDGTAPGQILYWDGSSWIFIPAGTKGQILTVKENNVPGWEYLAAPSVFANNPSDLTSEKATLNGTVNPNGFSSQASFEYGLTTGYGNQIEATQNPLAGNLSVSVSGLINGLSGNTTYHYRIKASNSVGVTYSADQTFTTNPIKPRVISLRATSLSSTSAKLKGLVNPNGASASIIFEYGVSDLYGVVTYDHSIPATQDTINGGTAVEVSADISGLTANTYYGFKIVATNSEGISEGNDIIFIILVDLDGNMYSTIYLSSGKLWMAENLKTTKFSDGTDIPNVTDHLAWSGLTTPAFCWYNNDAVSYKDLYGALYNGFTVNTTTNGGKNVCPYGFQVPTTGEWNLLMTYLGGSDVAGGKLKEEGIVHWTTPNTGATDDIGFTALPGGVGYGDASSEMGNFGNWNIFMDTWPGMSSAPVFYIRYDGAYAGIGTGLYNDGNSIRCIHTLLGH